LISVVEPANPTRRQLPIRVGNRVQQTEQLRLRAVKEEEEGEEEEEE
jgi:hypothetical protein